METKAENDKDTQIAFTVDLSVGSHQLAPVFQLEQGGVVGAYYTVVKKK